MPSQHYPRASVADTFGISRISPRKTLTIPFSPFCWVLSTIISTGVSSVCQTTADTRKKTSKCPFKMHKKRRVWTPTRSETPSFLLQALSVAGLGAGLTEAVVVNPFEVVKVSLQANRDAFKEVVGHKSLATCLCELRFIQRMPSLTATLLVRSSKTHHKDGRLWAERAE